VTSFCNPTLNHCELR